LINHLYLQQNISIIKTIQSDYLLIGGGIMTATLAVLLREKFTTKSITILERLPKVAEESTEAWNNAGTGHAGYCELNYTPVKEDGSVDISKALKINNAFENTMEFWGRCVSKGIIQELSKCVHFVPHYSFVWGENDVEFLEKRWNALSAQKTFSDMEFTKDKSKIKSWLPLIFEGRENSDEPMAATKIAHGRDVNFGEITDQIFHSFESDALTSVFLENEVRDLSKMKDNTWDVEVKDLTSNETWNIKAGFVFIGAGGGSLPLLEKANIPEADGYGGFPISGQWLRCTNKSIVEKHNAKVYSKAKKGAPPMSVPHLDTRIINEEKELLFGPFAGFSTKFLKNGSYFDLPSSIELGNVLSMIGAGMHNITLTKYLIEQVTLSMEDRMEALREFFPAADINDWELAIAGQRVQVIKKDDDEWGKLEFGTEMIISEDKTISGLLGASPGASTSYEIMEELMEKCF
jgi:malate dehydrogenase (quinone)